MVGAVALLGVTAACAGGEDTVASPGTPPSSTDERAPGAGASETWLVPYVGTWTGHGRQLVVRADGSGTMGGRTYVACASDDAPRNPGVPCEPSGGHPSDVSRQSVQVTVTKRKPGVHLTIVRTNDVNRAVGTYRTVLSHAGNVLTVTLGEGTLGEGRNVTFCASDLDDATSRDVCG
ncbi:hypothetical protein SAMN05443668_11615 [Cryptosporangium aurantiacum]|uniref:Uncharacterized protein n=2 Tax=Cryptosporangium aurantiacum TaxID=134849 RepID=A0A1M7RJZ1_9ACTN|nr:hypothetical protein SAMN05443668_11615 [Cryptosporangium aurantiacum]